MGLPYLKPVFVVFACFGVNIVEPFYANTISKDATHTLLKSFYIEIHNSLGGVVSDNFYTFQEPEYAGKTLIVNVLL